MSDRQHELLLGDLDFILPRTTCDCVQLTRPQVMAAMARDPDILIDLAAGMPPGEARWLAVPPDEIAALAARRHRPSSGRSSPACAELPLAV